MYVQLGCGVSPAVSSVLDVLDPVFVDISAFSGQWSASPDPSKQKVPK